ERLAGLGARLVTQGQPNLVLPGHILHQLASLDAGLAQLDDDTMVLKTRPDSCDPDDIRRLIELEPVAMATNRHIAMPFGHAVHILSVFGAHPFYINDMTFAGRAADLRALLRLPFLFQTRYVRMGPEQLYWGGAAAGELPVFDAYFRVNLGLIF